MMYNSVFVALIGVLLFGYVLERVLDALNLKHILPELPEELSGIFDKVFLTLALLDTSYLTFIS